MGIKLPCFTVLGGKGHQKEILARALKKVRAALHIPNCIISVGNAIRISFFYYSSITADRTMFITEGEAKYNLEVLWKKSKYEGFSYAQLLANDIQKRCDSHVETTDVGHLQMPSSMIDRTSLFILPENARCSNIQPITTTADGNCLFNAVSRGICDDEGMATKLRLLTSLELLKNQHFYSNHPAINHVTSMTKWSIYDAVIFNDRAPGRMSPAVFKESMERETIITLKNGAFSGVLQIMGLASAINCTIQMIYPDKKHRLYALLNGTFKPRLSPSSARFITIMWTNMSGWLNQSYTFTPNHFAPLLPVINYNNTWSVVSSKRKLKHAPAEKCTTTTTKKPSPRFFGDFVPAARKRASSPLKEEISPQKRQQKISSCFRFSQHDHAAHKITNVQSFSASSPKESTTQKTTTKLKSKIGPTFVNDLQSARPRSTLTLEKEVSSNKTQPNNSCLSGSSPQDHSTPTVTKQKSLSTSFPKISSTPKTTTKPKNKIGATLIDDLQSKRSSTSTSTPMEKEVPFKTKQPNNNCSPGSHQLDNSTPTTNTSLLSTSSLQTPKTTKPTEKPSLFDDTQSPQNPWKCKAPSSTKEPNNTSSALSHHLHVPTISITRNVTNSNEVFTNQKDNACSRDTDLPGSKPHCSTNDDTDQPHNLPHSQQNPNVFDSFTTQWREAGILQPTGKTVL